MPYATIASFIGLAALFGVCVKVIYPVCHMLYEGSDFDLAQTVIAQRRVIRDLQETIHEQNEVIKQMHALAEVDAEVRERQ